MEIQVQIKDIELTSSVRQQIQQRIKTSLGWAQCNIRRVCVFIADINGPRGGVDKRCYLQIVMKNVAPIHIEERQENWYLATDRAIDRANRVLSRKIDRQRQHRSNAARLTYPKSKIMAPFVKPMLEELRQMSMLKS